MLNRQRAITQLIVGIGALVDAEHGGNLCLRQVVILPQFPDSVVVVLHSIHILIIKIIRKKAHKT